MQNHHQQNNVIKKTKVEREEGLQSKNLDWKLIPALSLV